ncbi:HD domain-containing protein [bacterium]|nr:HD domain-containing protein [bacterium]
MEKKKFIRDFEPNEVVTTFLYLRRKELRNKKNEEPFGFLELVDKSGRIFGYVWENPVEIIETIENGVVKVRGKVGILDEQLILTIEKIRQTKEGDEFVSEDLIPSSKNDSEKIIKALFTRTKRMKNIYLQRLCELFFEDTELVELFKKAPAGKLWHHNYLGGLAEHTFGVVKICEFLTENYPHLDKDLLITAAIFHDLGKIYEMTYENYIDYSDKGRLLGSITLTIEIIELKTSKIIDFPEKINSKLKHLILSHEFNGKEGMQPKFIEAELLNLANKMDINISAYKRLTEKEKGFGASWSSYIKLLDRQIYFD